MTFLKWSCDWDAIKKILIGLLWVGSDWTNPIYGACGPTPL